jgi:hypothetical protein
MYQISFLTIAYCYDAEIAIFLSFLIGIMPQSTPQEGILRNVVFCPLKSQPVKVLPQLSENA